MIDVQEPRRTHIQNRGGLETTRPADRTRLPRRRRIAAYILAIVLPVLTAAAMIPLRVDHGRMAVLLLVIPVVVVALLGGFGPAIVAATVAVLAYDLFLVEPYYDLAISDSDEIVAAATLFGVGLVVGVLNARLVQLGARDTARLDELRHLVAFARVVTEHDDDVESRRCSHRAHHLRAQSSELHVAAGPHRIDRPDPAARRKPHGPPDLVQPRPSNPPGTPGDPCTSQW